MSQVAQGTLSSSTLSPSVVEGRTGRTRSWRWPLITGAALVALALGVRTLNFETVGEGAERAAVNPDSIDELLERTRVGSTAKDPAQSQARAEALQEAPASAKIAQGARRNGAIEPREVAPAGKPAPSVALEASGPAPVSSGAGSFVLQVASFEVKEVADGVARGLADQGFPARSEAYGGPKAGWWHVVRLGPFANRPEAEAMRLKLPLGQAKSAIVLPRPTGIYHVQVACLKSQRAAEDMADKLRARAHQARVTAAPDGGEAPWYCVRVGPFDDREEAEKYRGLLEARQGMSGRVIPFAPSNPPVGEASPAPNSG
jgi:cell division septation protein DedD